jgi:purine-binding chemotaxis protein CheW
MLLTVFTIGGAVYGIDAASLIEVLPLVHLEPIPLASAATAGTMNYHGMPIVVADLHRLCGEAPPAQRLTTRILLVQDGDVRFGLLAAGVTDTVEIDAGLFEASPPAVGATPWLGSRAVYGTGFVRRLEIAPLARTIGVAA